MKNTIEKLNKMAGAGGFTQNGELIDYDGNNVALICGDDIIPTPNAGRVKIAKSIGEGSALDIIRKFNDSKQSNLPG